MKTTLTLPLPPSVNGLFATDWKTKRRFPSKEYAAWRVAADAEVTRQRPKAIPGKVVLHYVLGRPKDNRKRDCFNYEKAVTDYLVSRGLIEEDNDKVLEGGSIFWSDDVEGVQVTIQDLASTIFKDEQAA